MPAARNRSGLVLPRRHTSQSQGHSTTDKVHRYITRWWQASVCALGRWPGRTELEPDRLPDVRELAELGWEPAPETIGLR